MFPGLTNFLKIAANVVVTNSTVLITSGLSSPIAANQKQKIRWWLPFSVGATGGFGYQLIVPAAGAYYLSAGILHNTGAGTTLVNVITASALFSNALANAGNHLLELEAVIENGVNPGFVDLQIAQDSADPLSLTALKGGWMATTVYQ